MLRIGQFDFSGDYYVGSETFNSFLVLLGL